MGYKVDRVGTPYFATDVVPYSRTLTTADFTAWAQGFVDSQQLPRMPEPTIYQQYGMVKLNFADLAPMDRAKKVSFGQQFSMPEVAQGNSYLIEAVLSVEYFGAECLSLTHHFAKLTTPASSSYGAASANSVPIVIGTLDRLNASTDTSGRKWENRAVIDVVSLANTLPVDVYAHWIEFSDTDNVAGTIELGAIRAALSFRAIHHTDVLKPYDPTR